MMLIHVQRLCVCVFFFSSVDKKYTGSNLKITELLDCSLIGVCAVIRSNTVFLHKMISLSKKKNIK